MKRFLMLTALIASLPATEALAAGGFPWFHTRPKPVFLSDESAAKAASPKRVPYHGAAVYPASGRLYFSDNVDSMRQGGQSHSQADRALTREWRNGSAPAPPAKKRPAK
jgi:hypothetical protein